MNSFFIEEAKQLGFIKVGFSRPERPLFFDKFHAWLAAGKHGDMNWLGRHLDIREDPKKLLEKCRTIITLAYPYPSKKPCTPDGYTAARYTQPTDLDYHDRIKMPARNLARSIVDSYPESKTRICVDSAPILERSIAYSSGIGFIGKNNMLIVPGYGSYVFLVEILTTAFIEFPKPELIDNQCGSCTLCVDSCPAGALEGPFSLNVSKCLSYLTIEYSGAVDSKTGKIMGYCFFGCDVCQEVCPFNEGKSSKDLSLPSTDIILGMGAKDFKTVFGKTALARVGLKKLKENIRAVRF